MAHGTLTSKTLPNKISRDFCEFSRVFFIIASRWAFQRLLAWKFASCCNSANAFKRTWLCQAVFLEKRRNYTLTWPVFLRASWQSPTVILWDIICNGKPATQLLFSEAQEASVVPRVTQFQQFQSVQLHFAATGMLRKKRAATGSKVHVQVFIYRLQTLLLGGKLFWNRRKVKRV